MQASAFEEDDFFRALTNSSARVLLIGRRAMIVFGIPVLTADYDLWVHIDDVDLLNRALEPFDLVPNRTAGDARRIGRYVLENDEHVDVLVARAASTKDGIAVAFDEVWKRRETVTYSPGISVCVPSLDDLILTKRWSLRPKDLEDILLLEASRRSRKP